MRHNNIFVQNTLSAVTYGAAAALGWWVCGGTLSGLIFWPAFAVAVTWTWFAQAQALTGATMAALVFALSVLHNPLLAVLWAAAQALGAWLARGVLTAVMPPAEDASESPMFWAAASFVAALGGLLSVGGLYLLRSSIGVPPAALFFMGLSSFGVVLPSLRLALWVKQRWQHGLPVNGFRTALLFVVFAGGFALVVNHLPAGVNVWQAGTVFIALALLAFNTAVFSAVALLATVLGWHTAEQGVLSDSQWLTVTLESLPVVVLEVVGFLLISSRNRAVELGEQLAATELSSRSILAALPDTVVIQDVRGNYRALLSAQAPWLVDRVSQLVGENVHHHYPPEEARRRLELIQAALRENQVQRIEQPLEIAGVPHWFEVRAVPYQADSCVILVRDITRRVTVQDALRVSERYSRSIIRAIPDLTVELDTQGLVQRVLAIPSDPLPFSPTDWTGQALASVLPPLVAATLQAEVLSAHALCATRSVEISEVWAGVTYTFDVRIVPYANDRALVLWRNVTSEKQAQWEAESQRRRLSLVTQNIRDMVLLSDIAGIETYVSPSCTAMLGHTQDEMTVALFLSLVVEADRPAVIQAKADVTARHVSSARLTLRLVAKNGPLLWVEADLYPVFGPGEAVSHVLFVCRDITNRRQVEEQLKFTQIAVSGVREGLMVSRENGQVIWVNESFTRITGYAAEDVLQCAERELLDSGFTPPARLEQKALALERTGTWQGELLSRKKDGGTFPEWRSVSRVLREDGEPVHVSLITDLSEEKEREDLIWRLSTEDTLTRLPNRTLFKEFIEQACSRARRKSLKFTVMTLRVNHLARMTDNLGAKAVDRLLREVGSRVTERLREMDVVARVGDDLFGFLMEDLRTVADISAQAARIMKIFEEPFHVSDEEVFLDVVLGISIYPEDSEDADTLLAQSGWALQEARAGEGAAYRFYSKNIDSRYRDWLRIETSLRKAILASDELRMHYQPQISLQSGKILGFEALLRWNSPRLGEVHPGEFIPIAEMSALINSLGHWVIRHVCETIKNWRKQGNCPPTVAINMSARQFKDNMLAAHLEAAIASAGIPPEILCVEITESTLMGNIPAILPMMRRVKAIGVQLVLDDFGQGLASLTHLKELPFDAIKIDRKLIDELDKNEQSLKVSRAIIGLAQDLGLTTIAEGVETQEQYERVRALGCDAFQGFLFSAPLPEHEALAMLMT